MSVPNTTVNRLTSAFDSLSPKMEFDIRSVGFEHSFNSASTVLLGHVFVCTCVSSGFYCHGFGSLSIQEERHTG